jgi:molecular chaperone HscA
MEGGHVSTLRLAIDLGTSHTVAVVRRGDEALRPLLFDGSPVLPSAIFSDPPRLHVGRDAERMAMTDPSRFEPHPKRRVDEGSVLLGNTEVAVVDMFVALLRRVASEAAQSGVPAGSGAVLTCPADWGAHRRGVLMNAATAAGFGAVQLVDEPVAAATYCLEVLQQQVPTGGAVAVFDFGGGTLDASVLRRERDGLRVLSVGGLDDLGGVDIDAALVGHLGQLIGMQSPRVWQRITNPGPQSEQRERRQFWDDVRAAKEMLSRMSSAPVHVPGMEGALHLTRDELERVAGPLIDRAVDETRRVLRASGVDPNDLSGLFLVGGSSRIPLVASRLHTRFGLAPAVPEQPELPVAYGGLLAAGGRTTGQAQGRVSAPPGQQHGPSHGPPHGPSHGPGSGRPPSAPQSGPPGMPQSVPVGMPHSGPPSGPMGGFPVSAPPGSYAPSSGPTPGSPVSGGPPSYPPFPPAQGFAPGGPPGMSGPPGRPMTPSMVPHQRPRRRGKLRYVIVGVVMSVLLVCGLSGYWVFNSMRNAFDDIASGDGTNSGNENLGEAGDLTKVSSMAVPGGGAVSTAVGPDVVYYAGVDGTTLQVAALGADGKQKWAQTLAFEPSDVRLNLTGSLLVVDADKAATHGGRDMRVVLDAATGTKKWEQDADRTRVVSFVGNDALIESTPIGSQPVTQRIDLNTGAVRWSATVNSNKYSVSDHNSMPVSVHAPEGPTGKQGIPGLAPWPTDNPVAGDWHQAVAADPDSFMGMDATAGKATVYDAATGKARSSGTVNLDDEHWGVYAGVLVGRLNDKVSPGRITLVGYGIDNFAKRWEVPLPAGSRLERIKPCGPQHMCVLYNANSKYIVVAMDLKDSKQVWTSNHDFGNKPDWYLLGSGLVFGEWEFGNIGKPALHDPATGAKKLDLSGGQTGASAIAGSGRWVVNRSVRYRGGGDGSAWTLTAVNLTTGKLTSSIDVSRSEDQLVNASIRNDLLAVVAKNHELVLARAPA